MPGHAGVRVPVPGAGVKPVNCSIPHSQLLGQPVRIRQVVGDRDALVLRHLRAGLPSFTLRPCSRNPSTNQYQLKVDSTPSTSIRSQNRSSAAFTPDRLAFTRLRKHCFPPRRRVSAIQISFVGQIPDQQTRFQIVRGWRVQGQP